MTAQPPGPPLTLSLSHAAAATLASRAADEVMARLADCAERDGRGWPEWMSAETAACYLDISEERIRKLKDRHEIPYYQEGPGCRMFFRRTELDDWMATFRRPPR